MSRFAGVLLALCAALPALAQEPEPKLSAPQRVDAVFSRYDGTHGPGCAVAVIENGQIVYKQGYGMANLDHDVPIRADSVFHVASVSKEFTAAAIALLALDGKLSLDDRVQEHLPWMPEFEHPVTIRNLVHHNSGIRDQWSLLGMSGWRYSEDKITDEDVVYLLRKQRDLNFAPGDRYLYSNSGYTLMGLIVKAVSGESLREFTTSRIFEPLGMTRTHFRDDFSEIVKDQAYGYERDSDADVFALSVTNFDTAGATSLLTTVEDMARWDRNFIDPVVGGQPFLDLIHQRGMLTTGEEQSYAFGLVHGTYRGLRTVGHGGADAGYCANFTRFPDQGYSFVTLCNLAQTNPTRLVRSVADIYLEEHLEPEEEVPGEDAPEPESVALDEAEIARLVGAYWWDEPGTGLQVSHEEDALRIGIGRRRFPVIHGEDGVFRVPRLNRTLRFEPATGPVQRMVLWSEGEEQEAESAVRLAPFDAERTRLGDYAGEYVSPEIPVVYYIEIEAERLSLRWLKRERAELIPIAEDLLVGADVGSLRFERDSSGAVTAFVLDAGRIRNFRFERRR